jgi:hypothetical protein
MPIRTNRLPRLSIGTDWTPLELLTEPFVTVTFRGYTVAIDVRVIATQLEYTFLLGAKSLSEPLENLRVSSDGLLAGKKVAVRKSGEERTASYEVRVIQ